MIETGPLKNIEPASVPLGLPVPGTISTSPPAPDPVEPPTNFIPAAAPLARDPTDSKIAPAVPPVATPVAIVIAPTLPAAVLPVDSVIAPETACDPL